MRKRRENRDRERQRNRERHTETFPPRSLMTNRQGSEKFFSKFEVACALRRIARSKPRYTAVQSQQKTLVKLSVHCG